MDFLEVMKKHIESLSYTPPIINIGVYNEESNSVAIRPITSSINSRDMSKGKIYPFVFQILVHHENNLFAYKISQDLLKDLEEPDVPVTSSDDSFVLINIINTTVPNFLEESSHGTLWTAVYQADLYIKGR